MAFSPPPPPPHSPSSSSSSPIFRFSPNSSSSSGSNFPILALAIVGILATAFLLVSYYIFVIKCCLNWHRFDLLLGRFSPSSNRLSAADPPTVYFPTTAPRGLDDSLIRLIPVIRFRKEALQNRGGGREETECLECAVCLSDFKEGEKLRVIPNCCHAFHIDCIDVWLQSNANCPLCRSSISSNTLSSIDRILNFPRNNDGFVVIEIRDNNLDEPRLVTEDERAVEDSITPPLKPEQGKQRGDKIHHLSSMDDECVHVRSKDDVFHGVQHVRRSISMDLSSQRQLSLEIREVLEKSRMQKKTEMSSSSGDEESSCSSSSNKGLRRSFFSFGSGRGSSRNAEFPV